MITCTICQEQFLDYLFELLEEENQKEFQLHLSSCPNCAALLNKEREFQGMLSQAAKLNFPEISFSAIPSTQEAKSEEKAASFVSATPSPKASISPKQPSHIDSSKKGKQNFKNPGVSSNNSKRKWMRSILLSLMLIIGVLGIMTPTMAQWITTQQRKQDFVKADHLFQKRTQEWNDLIRRNQEQQDQLGKEVAEIEKRYNDLLQQQNQELEKAYREMNNQELLLRLTGPQRPQPGAPNEWQIETLDRQGNFKPTKIEVVVRDQKNTKVYQTSFERSAIPATLDLPLTIWKSLDPSSELYIDIVSRDEHHEQKLCEKLSLAQPVYATFLTTDKPLYQPGQTLYFRSLTLDRTSFLPAQKQQLLQFKLIKPDGSEEVISQGVTRLINPEGNTVEGPDHKILRGLGCGSYRLPDQLPGGEYSLSVAELRSEPQNFTANYLQNQMQNNALMIAPGISNGQFVEIARRKFLVKQYQTDKLFKKLEFNAKSYGPGETVQFKAEARRTEGPVANAPVQILATVDGLVVSSLQLQTDADGKIATSFVLPKTITTDQGTVTATFTAGDTIETIQRPIPLIARHLQIDFYPEGGELVAGVTNRVYFQAKFPNGKPADCKGFLTDGEKTITSLETFSDLANHQVNNGKGIFSFTPEQNRIYYVKLTSPGGIEEPINRLPKFSLAGLPVQPTFTGYKLPNCKPIGVVMSIPKGVVSATEPVEVELYSATNKKLLVGAYTRGHLINHQTIQLKANTPGKVTLKSSDPSGGVTRVTVFEEVNSGNKVVLHPVAERLIYRQQGQQLHFQIHADQDHYLPGNKVQLNVRSLNEKEKQIPVVAMVAVINQSIITMADQKTDRQIASHFLLASEVEKPDDLEYADFLLSDNPKAAKALDLLLGTQGWRRFVEQFPTRKWSRQNPLLAKIPSPNNIGNGHIGNGHIGNGHISSSLNANPADKLLVSYGQATRETRESYLLVKEKILAKNSAAIGKVMDDYARASYALESFMENPSFKESAQLAREKLLKSKNDSEAAESIYISEANKTKHTLILSLSVLSELLILGFLARLGYLAYRRKYNVYRFAFGFSIMIFLGANVILLEKINVIHLGIGGSTDTDEYFTLSKAYTAKEVKKAAPPAAALQPKQAFGDVAMDEVKTEEPLVKMMGGVGGAGPFGGMPPNAPNQRIERENEMLKDQNRAATLKENMRNGAAPDNFKKSLPPLLPGTTNLGLPGKNINNKPAVKGNGNTAMGFGGGMMGMTGAFNGGGVGKGNAAMGIGGGMMGMAGGMMGMANPGNRVENLEKNGLDRPGSTFQTAEGNNRFQQNPTPSNFGKSPIKAEKQDMNKDFDKMNKRALENDRKKLQNGIPQPNAQLDENNKMLKAIPGIAGKRLPDRNQATNGLSLYDGKGQGNQQLQLDRGTKIVPGEQKQLRQNMQKDGVPSGQPLSVAAPPVDLATNEAQNNLGFMKEYHDQRKMYNLLQNKAIQNQLSNSNDLAPTAPAIANAPFTPELSKNLSKKRILIDQLEVEQKAIEGIPFMVREYAHFQHKSLNDNPQSTDTRNDFSETVYWHPALIFPETGEINIHFDLADDIAKYQILIAGHTLDGRIGSSIAKIEARKPFSLDTHLPKEITSSDRIDLPIAVNNDSSEKRIIQFRLDSAQFQQNGSTSNNPQLILEPNKKNRSILSLVPTIPYGPALIRIQGISDPVAPQDILERSLQIVQDGYPVSRTVSDVLEKRSLLRFTLPKDYIADSLQMELNLYPSILADLQSGLSAMLQEPHGCFEQTTSSNYPNLLILDFLKSTNTLNNDVRQKAEGLLQRGYEKLRSFESPRKDGNGREGYEWFGASPPHEALTAYGLLEFRDMQKVYPVNAEMVKRTQNYLLACKNDKNGDFSRNQAAIDHFGKAPAHITNAYIVWALTESDPDDRDQLNLQPQIDRLLRDSNDPDKKEDSYYLALIANSLLNRSSTEYRTKAIELLDRLVLLQNQEGSIRGATAGIARSGGRDLLVESTALTVLAWLKANDPSKFNEATAKAIRWITQQRSNHGSFGSTQSTILALKALLALTKKSIQSKEDGIITVTLHSKGEGKEKKIFKRGFLKTDLQVIHLPILDAESFFQNNETEIEIEVNTKCSFPFSLVADYRISKPENKSNLPLQLSTTFLKNEIKEGEAISLAVDLKNNENSDTGMAVAILRLPAGVQIPTDMKQLIKLKQDNKISFFEIRGRELILYWRALKAKENIHLDLDLIAEIPGEFRGPASRAYLYYTSESKHWVAPLQVKITPGQEQGQGQ